VDLSLQKLLLRCTHELLAEYVALPSWQDLWSQANHLAAAEEGQPRRSAVGDAAVLGVADMLADAVFDSKRQVMVLPAAAEYGGGAEAADDAAWDADQVEQRVRAVAAPYGGFFGRQHLAALLQLEGDWAMQALLEAAVDRFEEVQVWGWGAPWVCACGLSGGLKCRGHRAC